MKVRALETRFVVDVPEKLEPGILYISTECGVVTHLCCCGCGAEIVTPLTPDGWKITFDGETISLWPSVGNWNLPCKSHYVIDRSRVVAITDDDLPRGRRREYDRRPASKGEASYRPNGSTRDDGFWAKLKSGLSRKKR